MFLRTKSYVETKNSAVKWIGAIPKHWDVSRLKRVCRLAYGDSLSTEFRQDGDVPVFGSNGSVGHHRFANTESPCIVIGRKGSFGKVTFSSESVFAIDTTYYVDRSLSTVDLRWLFYVLGCLGLDQVSKDSAVPGLDRDDVYYRIVPLPPRAEQIAIASFLDHADRRIQRYIRAKQRLIALLEEQKQTVLHQTVTGKIDVRTGELYSAYKPSGVEWLGDVPDCWEVVPLRRVTLDCCDGPFGSGLKSSHYTENGVRVVRLQNIGHGEFNNSDVAFVSPEHYSSLGDHSVVSGDVLIAGLGDNNHPSGRACVAPLGIAPAMVKADCFRFRLNQDQIQPRFAALQLTATASVASAVLSTGATRQRTNLQATSGRAIGIPSVSEQHLIVEYLTAEVSRIRRARAAVQQEIDLLREYRTRLIADIVTGKLDVRAAAAKLPDQDA